MFFRGNIRKIILISSLRESVHESRKKCILPGRSEDIPQIQRGKCARIQKEMHTSRKIRGHSANPTGKVCIKQGKTHTFGEDLLFLQRSFKHMEHMAHTTKSRRHTDDLEIVFEDRWLIVVDKPGGLLTMAAGPAQGHRKAEGERQDTAYSRLYEYAGKIFIVHRLDRDTSGLLVFAKDQETKLALQENWDEAVQERKYVTVLEGVIEDEEGWIETWLYESPKSMKVHCYALEPEYDPSRPPRRDWHFASTYCRRLKAGTIGGQPYTMVEFELETGRKNQIRAHSEWIGHPIAGDRKYGARTNPISRLALHAQTLSFIHPWTGKLLRFTSKLPKSFKINP